MQSLYLGRALAATLFCITAIVVIDWDRPEASNPQAAYALKPVPRGPSDAAAPRPLAPVPRETSTEYAAAPASPVETFDPAEAAPELTADETERLALAAIDEIAAHPEDPQRPASVPGVPDEVLNQVDPAEIDALLEIATPYAMALKESEPRYLFQLGRAALAVGYKDRALELLKEASRNGSPAALAYSAMNADLSYHSAIRYLRDAHERGFEPAGEWYENYGKNIVAGFRPVTDEQLSDFKRPDILKAVHNRDVDELNAGTLEVWAYLASLIGGISDPQLLYLIERDQVKQLRALQNPGLSERIEARLLSDQNYIKESTKLGFASVLNGFQAIAESRKRGGSINDEVSAYTQEITKHTVPVEVAKQQGAHDAMTIGLDLPAHGELAEEVMRGIDWYFGEGVRNHQARNDRLEEERLGGKPSLGDAYMDWINRRSPR